MPKKFILPLVLAGILLAGVLLVLKPSKPLGGVTSETPHAPGSFRAFTFFASSTVQTDFSTSTAATSTDIVPYTTTSFGIDNGYFVVAGAKKVTMFFQRGDTSGVGSASSSTFWVETSPDGTTWYRAQNIISATSSARQDNAIVIATSTNLYSLDLVYNSVYAIRCMVLGAALGDQTGKQSHQCRAVAEW